MIDSLFQSTPPVWEATLKCYSAAPIPKCFNPRFPCGRRLPAPLVDLRPLCFNPRLPCGRRHQCKDCIAERDEFQSTPPVWEATWRSISSRVISFVSIHASRGGGDVFFFLFGPCRLRLNPPLPWGRRPKNSDGTQKTRLFQSTPPVWEATNHIFSLPYFFMVSIHASRVGGDPGSTTTN